MRVVLMDGLSFSRHKSHIATDIVLDILLTLTAYAYADIVPETGI